MVVLKIGQMRASPDCACRGCQAGLAVLGHQQSMRTGEKVVMGVNLRWDLRWDVTRPAFVAALFLRFGGIVADCEHHVSVTEHDHSHE